MGISRDEGLFGRRPVFKNIKELVDSYAEPFVDKTGRINGYALCNLDEVGVDWRNSKRNLWKLERFLIEIKHTQFRMGEKRYQAASAVYQTTGHKKQPYWC